MASAYVMTEADREVMTRGPVADVEQMTRWIADVSNVFCRRFGIPMPPADMFARFYVQAVTRQSVLKRHVDRLTEENRKISGERNQLQDQLVKMHREVVFSQLKAWELSSLIDVMSLDIETLNLPTAQEIHTGFAYAAP